MKSLHMVTFLLLAIGGLNWGLIGLFDFDLVQALLGSSPVLVRLVYVLVGLSAVYEFVSHKNCCKECSTGK